MQVGSPCICRLARVLSRTSALESLDLAQNGLTVLPDEVWNLQGLRSLDLSGECLVRDAGRWS
jgi:Leucine-rich repeat (LRR) protein